MLQNNDKYSPLLNIQLGMFQNIGNHFRRNKQWSATLRNGGTYLVALPEQLYKRDEISQKYILSVMHFSGDVLSLIRIPNSGSSEIINIVALKSLSSSFITTM